MVFSSTVFLFVFLPVVMLINFLLPKPARNYWLLIVSFFFYGWGEPRIVLVLAASSLMNALLALWIDALADKAAKARRAVLILAVILNLGCLFIFKYLNFSLSVASKLLPWSVPVTSIALPIGISFFTFQALSYVIDVYRGDVPVQKNPLKVALYIAFFPQLIAGPIVRYKTISEEIDHRTVTMDDVSQGIRIFLIGFLKKLLLANTLAIIADDAFGATHLSVMYAWLGLICYSLQILFDFSGYSEMAIGLGRMFGFHFMKNFDYPYISASISEFWRRWHISLGTWFRDYVYFPLGGSRVKNRSTLVRNLLIVWGLTGIWHGANWTFLIWGLMYFVLITFEKLSGYPNRLKHRWARMIYRIFTLFCVAMGWLIFRSEGVHAALNYGKSLFAVGTSSFIDATFIGQLRECAVPLVIGLILCTPAVSKLADKLRRSQKSVSWIFEGVTILGYALLFAVALSQLVMGAHNPFIYFNF